MNTIQNENMTAYIRYRLEKAQETDLSGRLCLI